MGSVQIAVKDYDILKKKLQNMKKAPAAVISRTVSDIRQRAPAWIAAEVSKVYGISKKDVSERGHMKVVGDRVDEMKLVYKGTAMTAVHFGMTPKVPKVGQGSYVLKAQILRGKTSVLGRYKKQTKRQYRDRVRNLTREGNRRSGYSPIMLQKTGTSDAGKIQYIPFQRKNFGHDRLDKIVTLSVPQMIQNEKVSPNISRVINENLDKRFGHHMKLLDK